MAVGYTVWWVRGTLGCGEYRGEGSVGGCIPVQRLVRVGSCCWVCFDAEVEEGRLLRFSKVQRLVRDSTGDGCWVGLGADCKGW
jgi:hypothetical protein